MSILGGPYDSPSEEDDKRRDEELLVFGYACKLYRNDAKSVLENSGQLLIPWMGDRSLMVDRYDARNKLDDKGQFGLKPNLPRPTSAEEMDLEDEVDKERYLALEWDEIRVEEQEEMEKRKKSAYSAIGFNYDTPSHTGEDLDGVPMEEATQPRSAMMYDYNMSKRMEHPSTATVDHGTEEDQFILPPDFPIPGGIQLPSTNKLHSIIEKTASFVCKQGNQMEIIIKTKQKFNPYFSFLNHEDSLYPYYKHLKEVISSHVYVPPMISIRNGVDAGKNGVSAPGNLVKTEGAVEISEEKEEDGVGEGPKNKPASFADSSKEDTCNSKPSSRRRSKTNSVTETDSDNSDSDDEGYLHPLLLGGGSSSQTKTSPAPPSISESFSVTQEVSETTSSKKSEQETKKMSLEEIMSLHNTTASFMMRTKAINSAPLALVSEGEATRAYATDPGMDAKAVAAYEYYKQQYCDANVAASAPVAVDNQDGWYGYNQPMGGYTAVYEGDPPQQYIPMNGQYESHQSSVGGLYERGQYEQHQTMMGSEHHQQPHSNYAPPPPPSEHQCPPPYYQCPPEAVPPPEIRAIVDKTAEYVAKNSEKFERTVLERHLSDPRFSFLNPWDPYNYYYETTKQYHRSMNEMTPEQSGSPPSSQPPNSMPSEVISLQKQNLQKLSSSGSVSFKLKPPKGSSAAANLTTPASGFEEEYFYDEDEDEDEDDEKEEQDEEDTGSITEEERGQSPPSKRQKVADDSDEIGTTVQAFLSTVKGLFNHSSS